MQILSESSETRVGLRRGGGHRESQLSFAR